MAGGRFRSKALRRDEKLAALLARLDVPECGCRTPCFCLGGPGGDAGFPPVCPGPDVCTACPAKPCAHVSGIDARDFPLSIDEWTDLLCGHDPAGCGEPPAPEQPTMAMTREGKLGVLIRRAEDERALHHAADVRHVGPQSDDGQVAGAIDHLAIRGVCGKRQGGVYATWHEEDDGVGEQVGLDLDLDREVIYGVSSPCVVRSLEFDRAVARAAVALGRASEVRLVDRSDAQLRDEQGNGRAAPMTYYDVRLRRPADALALLLEARRRGFRLHESPLVLCAPSGAAALAFAALMEELAVPGKLVVRRGGG